MKKTLLVVMVVGLLLMPALALADSISPDTVTIFGDPNQLVTETVLKTVTIDGILDGGTYSIVALDLSEVPNTVGVVSVPIQFSAPPGDPYSREETRTFDFNVVFAVCCRALDNKNVDFNIYALVDGVRVATETDHVICTPIPGSLVLMGTGVLGIFGIGLRRKSA